MNAGGNEGSGVGFDSITGAALRLLVGGVNQLNADDTTGFAVTTGGGGANDCRKNEGGDDDGDGGFRNPNIRATMLGDGALMGSLVPLLVGAGGEIYSGRCCGLAATSGGLFSTTRDHRMESRGRKQMQKRRK